MFIGLLNAVEENASNIKKNSPGYVESVIHDFPPKYPSVLPITSLSEQIYKLSGLVFQAVN